MNWVEYILDNENEALKELYTLYRGECVQWLHKNYALNHEDAREVFQVSIVILYDNVITGKLVNLTSSIKTYLFAIAKNKAQEFRRTSHSTISSDDILLLHIMEDAEDKSIMEENFLHMENSLASLGNPCQQVLELFYYKKWKMPKIAEALNYKNTDTVKNIKYKCLKRLQKLFYTHKEKGGSSET